MLQVDAFSVAIAVVALLVGAGLLIAYAVNPRLTAFRWWAASFGLLAIALSTATLRMDAPSAWIKSLSWCCFYASAALIAYGLDREGATRTNPLPRILAGAVLLLGLTAALVASNARPDLWVLAGPVPTLFLMAWCLVLVMRAGAWSYGLALMAGMGTIALRAVWYAADIQRMAPPFRPALRGTFGIGGELTRGPGQGLPPPGLGPPPRVPPAVEQHLTITLLTIAAVLGLALALVLRDLLAAHNRMRERSTTDALTGLLNRATFDERAAAMLIDPAGQPACLVLFDIDHFKRINDTCGHPAGDRVIARLGQLVSQVTLGRSIAGRIGGEEFALLLSASELPAARLSAEAIRTGFSASDFSKDIIWPVTLSAGVAQCGTGESLQSVIARADKALYAAKDRGRDQVVVAQDPGGQRPRRFDPAMDAEAAMR